jgi:hypothetical protein
MIRETRRPGSDYDVGYCKPPKHSRFAPGRTGNPKGRRKGARNFRTDIRAILRALVTVTRNGKSRRLPTQEAVLLRLCERALAGDTRALDRFIALARTYNDQEPVEAGGLAADDVTVLEVYQQRVLSGAASTLGRPGEKLQNSRARNEGDSK